MKKVLFIFSIFCSCFITKNFSQNDGESFCKFTVSAGAEIRTGFRVSKIGIRGVPGNIADKVLEQLDIKRGDELTLDPDSLCTRLKNGIIYKKYYLSSVEFYPDSATEIPNGGIVRFKFEKIGK